MANKSCFKMVSQLIKELTKAYEKYGDFEVAAYDMSDSSNLDTVNDAYAFEFRLLKNNQVDELPGMSFEDKEIETEEKKDEYFGIIFRNY